MKLYEIDKDYLLFLHNIDDNVSLEHPNANSRKFLGVVCEINNIKYYAPLGSPKEKHKTMHEGLDLYKIKNGELGMINFNNIIPVSDDVVSMFDLSILINDDPKYRNMML
ncbi:type III toxin-antitoxin system ToxN/AbiQ family toxin [Propionispira raffinosivorans]|uniref:type III toxin-antitoxin system ToxN/AbiQ family toxin n=1 Tax=Propionispira raffinosivorans TaxID=86959 RepID=UPI0009FCEF51